jgi:hypothetical protein
LSPPACRITRSPATSGEVAKPQLGSAASSSALMSRCQTFRPDAASRATSRPCGLRRKTRFPATAGVEIGPSREPSCPRYVGPSEVRQISRPVAVSKATAWSSFPSDSPV